MKSLLWCFALFWLFGPSYQWIELFTIKHRRQKRRSVIHKYLETKCNAEKICYMRGSFLGDDAICKPEGYIPGGGITTVKQITAPKAVLQKEFLGILAGKASGNLGNSGNILGAMNKFRKFFDKASQMAPFIGALSGIFGFFVSTPSAQDAVDASNKAIKQLTVAVNDRLDEMKGYVGSKILDSEKEWTVRKYEELYNTWADCMVHQITVKTVNECQRSAFSRIRAARPHFLVYKGKETLTKDEFKRLEVTFLTIRDYAMLNLMVLRSLVDSFKAEKGDMAHQYYTNFLKLTVAIAQQLVEYATFANNQIMDVYDTQILNSCKDTFVCGAIIERDHTRWWELARITSVYRECYCKMRPDVSDRQRCKVSNELRMDYKLDHSQYEKYDYSHIKHRHSWYINAHSAMDQRSKDLLFPLSSTYWQTTSNLVRTYWDKNVMNMVPLWKEIGDNAKQELGSIGATSKREVAMDGYFDSLL